MKCLGKFDYAVEEEARTAMHRYGTPLPAEQKLKDMLETRVLKSQALADSQVVVATSGPRSGVSPEAARSAIDGLRSRKAAIFARGDDCDKLHAEVLAMTTTVPTPSSPFDAASASLTEAAEAAQGKEGTEGKEGKEGAGAIVPVDGVVQRDGGDVFKIACSSTPTEGGFGESVHISVRDLTRGQEGVPRMLMELAVEEIANSYRKEAIVKAIDPILIDNDGEKKRGQRAMKRGELRRTVSLLYHGIPWSRLVRINSLRLTHSDTLCSSLPLSLSLTLRNSYTHTKACRRYGVRPRIWQSRNRRR